MQPASLLPALLAMLKPTSLDPNDLQIRQSMDRLRIAQCLLALVFGIAAGFVTQAVVKAQARRSRRATETGEPSADLKEPGAVHR